MKRNVTNVTITLYMFKKTYVKLMEKKYTMSLFRTQTKLSFNKYKKKKKKKNGDKTNFSARGIERGIYAGTAPARDIHVEFNSHPCKSRNRTFQTMHARGPGDSPTIGRRYRRRRSFSAAQRGCIFNMGAASAPARKRYSSTGPPAEAERGVVRAHSVRVTSGFRSEFVRRRHRESFPGNREILTSMRPNLQLFAFYSKISCKTVLQGWGMRLVRSIVLNKWECLIWTR